MNEAVDLMPAPFAKAETAPPGRRLAEARQAQNLTPADVARHLKLSVSQVDALEAGRYHQLPGPIFVRGFIRNYARLVKLDAGELLRAAGDSLPQPVTRGATPPSQNIPFPAPETPRWPLYAGAAVAIVAALAVYEFYWNEPEATITSPAAVASPAPAAAAKVAAAPIAAPVAPSESAAAGEVSAAGAEAGAVEPAAAPADAQQEALRPQRPGERQVKLDFDEESWVEIRDRDDRIIFSQLNRPGTQQFVHGLPPFSIVVGNAHRVRLTYDDRPVDLAQHTKIDVARLILQ